MNLVKLLKNSYLAVSNNKIIGSEVYNYFFKLKNGKIPVTPAQTTVFPLPFKTKNPTTVSYF